MKTLLLAVATLFVSQLSIAQQDTVLNGGFEAWGTNPFYDEADHWTTLNPFTQLLQAELAFRATAVGEFNSGTAAMKLVTTNILGVGVTPSILTNGTVNSASQTVEGGTEFVDRPLTFNFSYRFDNVNNDSSLFSVTFSRWNATSGMTEVVGSANAVMGSTAGAWVNAQFSIDYQSQEQPDSVLILFASGDDINPAAGSALFIDDLFYGYTPAGIAEETVVSTQVYPNPVSDVVSVRFSGTAVPNTFVILGLDGRTILSGTCTGALSTIDVSAISAGTYIMQLRSKEGGVASTRFVKN